MNLYLCNFIYDNGVCIGGKEAVVLAESPKIAKEILELKLCSGMDEMITEFKYREIDTEERYCFVTK